MRKEDMDHMMTREALMREAEGYRARAYAPYSRFSVGAALLTADGSVFGGCNVENASYGLGICAERVAMTAAVLAGKRDPIAIAVSGGDQFCPPCGGCRQFLAEFNPEMEVYLMRDGKVISLRLGENLLPHRFILGAR